MTPVNLQSQRRPDPSGIRMKNSPLQLRRTSRGFALVVVLGTLVLLVVLAVGFLMRATTERSAASGARSAAAARQMGDTAVSLIQGQINIATTQGSSVSWASQPGMIRTFDTGGSPLKAYKLYSASNMVTDSVSLTEDAPPGAWSSDIACWTDLNASVSGSYPILDPSALNVVEGFSVASPPVASYAGANPIPMPVKWLYVLRDGTMVAPSGSGKTATVSGETATNPIVGRVAFWTDDETCKVNVNTASEGTYWDIPRADTSEERKLARNQPVQKEFQRYPGHAAMTSLSTVFPSLTPDQIYNIVPRINGGGSEAGTKATVTTANSTSGVGGGTAGGTAIVPDTDRLYASVDELVFTPTRGTNGGLNKSQLEQAKFFLTARSRAPEVNLFNLPRVAIWPIDSSWANNPSNSNATGLSKTSAFDRLIAFCSSINSKPYYFQRADSKSTNELAITRNDQLYSYLQSLTGRAFPGFGGNFLSKYSSDRDQILTEIFDYIRSANPTDETLAYGKRFTPDFFPGDPNRPAVGYGQITPTIKGNTMGFGRVYTLSEMAIAFVCVADGDVPDSNLERPANLKSGTPTPPFTPLPPGKIRVKAIIIPEFFSPMMGYAGIVPDMQVSYSVDNFTYNGEPMDFQPSVTSNYTEEAGRFGGGSTQGGGLNWVYFALNKNSPSEPFLISRNSFVIDKTQTTVPFTGGRLWVTFKYGGSSTTAQTIRLQIPDGTFPVPRLSSNRKYWEFQNTSYFGDARLRSAYGANVLFPLDTTGVVANPSEITLPNSNDVVRSVVPDHGDYRLIAAQNLINDGGGNSNPTFIAHPRWNTPDRIAATLSGGARGSFGLSTASKYFTGLTYSEWFVPDIIPGATRTPELTGDFDTGVENSVDGAYVNKPDQGNTDAQNGTPYFESDRSLSVNTTFFSPNRQMPSPGMFGSLPTGVKAGKPWQTLLFRPQTSHPSYSATIPDHLFMDLFWMPVVEPYAISEAFSTSGKINLNYQILPFTYITRSTGINALLKSEKLAVIPDSAALTYKSGAPTLDIRKTINVPETLSQFTDKFNAKEVFRSASEIADIHIVPSDGTASTMSSYWNTRRLTGENLREHIYTTLYPRITTKSNTYTVHFRAQALSKSPNSTPGTWTEGKDKIAGEYRGSTTIERFIEPNNPDIPDYGSSPTATPTLDAFYRWRTVENKQFAP